MTSNFGKTKKKKREKLQEALNLEKEYFFF